MGAGSPAKWPDGVSSTPQIIKKLRRTLPASPATVWRCARFDNGLTDYTIVTYTKPLALLAFALTLGACSNSPVPHPASNLDWNTPGMQLGGDNGLPLRVESPCRKRGCDNDKLFFNPGQTEPNVNTIHRGW